MKGRLAGKTYDQPAYDTWLRSAVAQCVRREVRGRHRCGHRWRTVEAWIVPLRDERLDGFEPRCISSPPRSGYGAACLAGVRAAADCAVIAFIDGDGSDDPADLRRLVAPIRAGEQDFVIGSRARGTREAGSMGAHQLLAGKLAGLAMRALYGVRYTDMGPLRAIRRDTLERLAMRERTYGWNLEMQMRAARARLRILELPVSHRNRAGGVSKVAGSLRGTVRASWNLATTFVRVVRAR
jgi:glycosyltransferase involved in cell wall biosynthesis